MKNRLHSLFLIHFLLVVYANSLFFLYSRLDSSVMNNLILFLCQFEEKFFQASFYCLIFLFVSIRTTFDAIPTSKSYFSVLVTRGENKLKKLVPLRSSVEREREWEYFFFFLHLRVVSHLNSNLSQHSSFNSLNESLSFADYRDSVLQSLRLSVIFRSRGTLIWKGEDF